MSFTMTIGLIADEIELSPGGGSYDIRGFRSSFIASYTPKVSPEFDKSREVWRQQETA